MRVGSARQEHGDDAARPVSHTFLYRRAHLFVLPGAQPGRAEKDDARAAGVKCLLDGLLPGLAGHEVPAVEKGLKPGFLAQAAGDDLHRLLVGAVVTHKDVILWHNIRSYVSMSSSCGTSVVGPSRGRQKAKVEPTPNWLSTQMRPPCVSTIDLAMDSPSPEPTLSCTRG